MTNRKPDPGLFFEYYERSGPSPRLFFAPGRVNLIGEHTDYNDGYVFPCALNFGTYLWIRNISKPVIRLASTNFDFKAEIPLLDLQHKVNAEWVNYPLGILDQLIKNGIQPMGAELLFSGNIPNGAGLSSSASIELVTIEGLCTLWELQYNILDKIRMSQKAENEFVGMNCGIMDQFAVAMGKKNHALFLNCGTLEYEQVPMKVRDYRIVISNTNKRRGLTDSKYNERRQECEMALTYLRKARDMASLSGISLSEFKDLQQWIPDPVLRKRAHHVISENHRVLEALQYLKNGNLEKFGELMNASHDSLKDDYEVTGIELDTLVSEARNIDGVIGSRMTGAGFGGCTVSLVHTEQLENFTSRVGQNYQRKTDIRPDFYFPEIGNGVGEIRN